VFKKISPFFVYQISGNSMAPAFLNGEKVLVFVWAYIMFKPRINDVVICKFHKNKLIKRIQRIDQNEIFVIGDNKKESTDSRSFGYLSTKNILGKVIFKI